MKRICFLFCFLISGLPMVNSLFATLNYTMVVSTPGFTPLGAGKTAVPNFNNGCGDQMVSSPINLGFTFQYNGAGYTQFEVSDNGEVFLGAPAISCNENCGVPCTSNFPHGIESNDLSAGVDRPAICPLWDDLGFTVNGSGLSYQMSGVAPNRVMTIEWLLMDWKYNNSATPHGAISFQVKLYESPAGQIDFIYRQEAQPLGTLTLTLAPSASIGLMGGAGDYYSTDNTGATISKTVQTSIISKPANGVQYRWTDLGTLPIELISFTGKNWRNGNLLEWKTASETGNDYFTVERSTDASHFESIESLKGAGNSNSTRLYDYLDTKLPNSEELLYYRLKQTDFDNEAYYSPIIAVDPAVSVKPPVVYFDEASDRLSVSCYFNDPGLYRFDIIDIMGRPVYSQEIETGEKEYAVVKMALPFSAKGIYMAKLISPAGNMLSQSKFTR